MTTRHTALEAGIIDAIAAAKTSRAAIARQLGITDRTFSKYLASDGFTFRQLQEISVFTGVKLQTILAGVTQVQRDAA